MNQDLRKEAISSYRETRLGEASAGYLVLALPWGWVVTCAAAGLGLVFGITYVWSVLKSGIPDVWGWSNADKALPYSLLCLMFSATMVPAGRLQDRFGPRLVILLGGFLCGLGLIVSGLGGTSVTVYAVGFGCITGAGVGFGYSATTPASIKWFPPERTGLISGIVVGGSGFAPVLLAPLASFLLHVFEAPDVSGKGLSHTMITLGLVTWGMVGILAPLVRNPPEGLVALRKAARTGKPVGDEFTSKAAMGTAKFWLLYIMFFCGASAGLMFISVAQDLGKHALGEWAFFAVVVLAVGNAGGRILAGAISDKIGRQWTLFSAYVCQGLAVVALFLVTRFGVGSWPVILLIVFLLGMNYGANLSIFPAACKDYFGMRNFGLTYGFLFTAFGLAGLIMPWANGVIKDATGNSDLSYFIILMMMGFSAVLTVGSYRLGHPRNR